MSDPTGECKHGLKHGCVYCHGTRPTTAAPAASTPPGKKRTRGSSLSEKMNDRMTALKRRLREIRGEKERLPDFGVPPGRGHSGGVRGGGPAGRGAPPIKTSPWHRRAPPERRFARSSLAGRARARRGSTVCDRFFASCGACRSCSWRCRWPFASSSPPCCSSCCGRL